MPHIAICVWGICRSTNYTIESIERHIFRPLNEAGCTFTVFLHTYTLHRPYSNPRAGETKQQLKNTLWKYFKPSQSIVEDQDSVDPFLNLSSYRTHGNPWSHEDGNEFQTLDNHIHALWSLYQVTKLWIPEQDKFTHILYIRPDVQFLTSLRPAWFQSNDLQTIHVPNFHLIDGVNDRFAIGHPASMRIYGTRFLYAYEYSLLKPLHSESFLSWILSNYHINCNLLSIKFRRIRADGTICEADKYIGL